jgi:hypothetical protein
MRDLLFGIKPFSTRYFVGSQIATTPEDATMLRLEQGKKTEVQ